MRKINGVILKKGLSFTLCFGTYGGFYTELSNIQLRICLGFVAFTIYFFDLEDFINNLRRKI